MSAILLASLALARAPFNANKTTEAKRPIIAITTNNSIKVNPALFLFLNVFTPNLILKIILHSPAELKAKKKPAFGSLFPPT
jgi:hypothetical protein